MRYLSVCSGIEAATLAWSHLGWTPAAFSEIEPFARALLQHHYPEVPIHGDFTTIGADDYGPVDLLCGGTPCQDFSLAGKRAGMDGERGNLTLEFLRLLDRKRPRWMVWENVLGVLSSNEGRDFGAFLGQLGELGYGWAYRVLDAQFFGVPQRRRRVFVVGYLGDARRAQAVLFERHSLSGYPPPRRETRTGIAADAFPRAGGNGAGAVPAESGAARSAADDAEHSTGARAWDELSAWDGTAGDGAGDGVTTSLTVGLGSGGPDLAHAQAGWLVASNITGEVSDTAPTLDCRVSNGPRRNQEAALLIRANDGVTHALTASGHDASEDDTGRGTPLVVGFQTTQYVADGVYDGSPAVTSSYGGPPAIAFTSKDYGGDAGEIAPTLRSMNEVDGNQNGGGQIAVAFYPNMGANARSDGASVEVAGTVAGADGGNRQAVAFTTGIEPHVATGEVAFTLTIPSVSGGGQPQAVAFAQNCRSEVRMIAGDGSLTGALGADAETQQQTYVAFQSSQSGVREVDTHATLDANNGSRRQNGVIANERGRSTVRRLTPRECEALQGVPLDYTLVPDPRRKGKLAADQPRYHALGNTWAVPCVRWIGERIAMVDAIP